ncbi:sulfotransferase family 2 domain-containing protein [Leisingera sp. ANG-S5]|uniref:sulfotransferase family 2 domain-containing protein n=1 Tax=Leisingera sp. ANG-S5 TaxID=1577901 RepID=UPI00057E589A|nr:sulfotransferase family 2 domain-containing protein [Leisingera sp. ANG-S5]KIC28697.1 hypothetical protein RA25_21005 [Leisingera sp. ANG-S5]
MTTRLLYIHVPKCGGTSLGSAVRLAYFHSQATISLRQTNQVRNALYPAVGETERDLRNQEIRQIMLAGLMARKVKCVSAHVYYNARVHQEIDPERKVVTMLRDPVARFLSHYAYVKRNHPDPGHAKSLEAFLETEAAMRYGSTYLLYFASTYQHVTQDLAADMELARQNLSRFSVIGNLDRAGAYRTALRKLTGRPLLSWERNKRPGRKPSSAKEIPAELRARIEQICAPDIALYNFAQKLPSSV